MSAATYTLTFPGAIVERGFWLYVWRVETPVGEKLYVGRTGDSSSPNASSPFQRMGQHLGHNPKQNVLRRHLENIGIRPEDCAAFRLIAHGPLFAEADSMAEHVGLRDTVAALEKALADTLEGSGYAVLNTVECRKPLDQDLWGTVLAAFAGHFPSLDDGGR